MYRKIIERKAICDECGFEYSLSQLKNRWDGAKVCQDDWEIEHPQNKIRVRAEKLRRLDGRPEPPDTFLSDNEVTQDSL